MSVIIQPLSHDQMPSLLEDAVGIYGATMRYSSYFVHQLIPIWHQHIAYAGWKAVGGFYTGSSHELPCLIGIAYGYSLTWEQSWYRQVAYGLYRHGYSYQRISELLDHTFEIAELHVHPHYQAHGIGEGLVKSLLTDSPHKQVVLSTLEDVNESNRAWKLYHRLGFTDLLRQHRFVYDQRDFAILYRQLPL